MTSLEGDKKNLNSEIDSLEVKTSDLNDLFNKEKDLTKKLEETKNRLENDKLNLTTKLTNAEKAK